MRLTELDIVNDCLATLGEAPLNSLNEDHPLVAAGLKLLREATARVQAQGWWFNREVVTLQPDAGTGHIALPADFLSVDPSDRGQRYTERGRRLYDLERQSVLFDHPVNVAIIRLVRFRDLPWSAQDLVRAATVIRFVESYDADPQRIEQVRIDYVEAFRACNTEHTRFTQPNLLSQGGVGLRRGKLRVTGGRPTRGLPR